ncbi:cyclin-dependent kinase inhibitor 1 [Grus japonensis]|uniref:Cyclin-dependent kinase inhibitor 1 n=4 Tax=Gruidae TaxID=9109 RepID=A0ABC9XRJ1_GRUJA
MLCPGRALPAGGGVGNINICTFPILLHHTRLCLTSVMLKSLPKTPLKSQMSKMSTGRWRSPLGCLIAEPNAPCPTLATVRVALVATVLALGLACGLSNTPVTCSAFLPAITMPLSQSRARQVPCSSKVCRNLFGPVDHHQLQNDSEKLLKQHLEEAQQRWNFNFETETPLEGQFKWERVFLAEQLPQEVHNLVKVTSSESRSSLVRKVSPKDCLGRICPEGSQQSLEVYRAGSPQSLKRGQTTIKDFYSSKRKIVPDKPKP